MNINLYLVLLISLVDYNSSSNYNELDSNLKESNLNYFPIESVKRKRKSKKFTNNGYRNHEGENRQFRGKDFKLRTTTQSFLSNLQNMYREEKHRILLDKICWYYNAARCFSSLLLQFPCICSFWHFCRFRQIGVFG